jgi:hypothetical protein
MQLYLQLYRLSSKGLALLSFSKHTCIFNICSFHGLVSKTGKA